MLSKISLAKLGLVVGSILTVIGLIAYATNNATLNLAGFFYGIPLVLGGLALQSSELNPIPFSVETSPEVLKLRQEQATITHNKLRQDVTRYRYGQDVHLDEALKKLALGQTDDELPVLISIKEKDIQGKYALFLLFESPFVPLNIWQERQEKMEKFFGPDITITITELEGDRIDLGIIKV